MTDDLKLEVVRYLSSSPTLRVLENFTPEGVIWVFCVMLPLHHITEVILGIEPRPIIFQMIVCVSISLGGYSIIRFCDI